MPPNRNPNRNRNGKGSTTPYARPDTTTIKQEEVTSSETFFPHKSTQTALSPPNGVNNGPADDALSYFRRQLNPDVVRLAAQSRVEDNQHTVIYGGPVQQQLPLAPVVAPHLEKENRELKEKIKTLEKRNEGLRMSAKQTQTHQDRLKQKVKEGDLKYERLGAEAQQLRAEAQQLRKDNQALSTRAKWLQDKQSEAGAIAKAVKELAEKIKQKDQQLDKSSQHLWEGLINGFLSELPIIGKGSHDVCHQLHLLKRRLAIPPGLLGVCLHNLPGENLNARLSPFSTRVMSEMNEAYHKTYAEHSSSLEISAHLLKALEPFYPVIELFKDRGIQKLEEEPLRYAYTMYDKAINCSHSPKGWQFGQSSHMFGSQVFDSLKLLRWDLMLAETITKGVELGWKVTREELAEDLEVIKTVRLDAIAAGKEWYPRTVEAMEKAISAA